MSFIFTLSACQLSFNHHLNTLPDCEAPQFAGPAMNSKRAFSLPPCLALRWGQPSKSCGADIKSITARLMRKQKRTSTQKSPETRLTRELRRPLPSALPCRVQICKDKFLIATSAFCSVRGEVLYTSCSAEVKQSSTHSAYREARVRHNWQKHRCVQKFLPRSE